MVARRYVLGRIGSGRVLPLLRRWVGHEDERVRVEVARSLGRVHDPDAPFMLLEMLADPSWRVRQSAVWSLAALRDPHVLPRLRALLFEDRSFRSRRSESATILRTYFRLAETPRFRSWPECWSTAGACRVVWQAECAVAGLRSERAPQTRGILRAQKNSRDGRLRQAVEEALAVLGNRSAAKLAGEDDWSVAARIAEPPSREVPFRIEFAEER